MSDIDMAKFYIHFFRPLAQCQFIRVLIYIHNTLSG